MVRLLKNYLVILMKKLTKDELREFLTFLNDHKSLVGLSDWNIFLSGKPLNGDVFATSDVNIFEQTITVEVDESLLRLEKSKRESILLHELIHSRISVFKQIVEKLTDFEEERLANDLERGMYSLLEVKENE